MVLLHRFIVGAPDGLEVDHKNGDGLDCRRSNLRLATRTQNAANRSKQWGTVSRFKGVYLNRKTGKWQAQIWCEKKQFRGRIVETEEEAARDYDRLAVIHAGEFASLNFPEDCDAA